MICMKGGVWYARDWPQFQLINKADLRLVIFRTELGRKKRRWWRNISSSIITRIGKLILAGWHGQVWSGRSWLRLLKFLSVVWGPGLGRKGDKPSPGILVMFSPRHGLGCKMIQQPGWGSDWPNSTDLEWMFPSQSPAWPDWPLVRRPTTTCWRELQDHCLSGEERTEREREAGHISFCQTFAEQHRASMVCPVLPALPPRTQDASGQIFSTTFPSSRDWSADWLVALAEGWSLVSVLTGQL